MAPYEALLKENVELLLCWDHVGERKLLGPELVKISTAKMKLIQEHMKIAQDRHKCYADNRRSDLEFETGDYVFLRIST